MKSIKFFVLAATVFTFTFIAPPAFAENGVTDSEIVLGQSCALEGPAKALGTGMRAGLEAYFAKVNQARNQQP